MKSKKTSININSDLYEYAKNKGRITDIVNDGLSLHRNSAIVFTSDESDYILDLISNKKDDLSRSIRRKV